MIHLHEASYNETLVRHWANEIESPDSAGYDVATYRIRQVETGVVYDEAVDVVPCRYAYEATDEKIESIQGG